MNLRPIRNLTLLAALLSLIGMALVDPHRDPEMAYKALEARDPDLAVRLATRALTFGSLTPEESAEALRVRAQAARRLDRPDFALADLGQVIAANSKDLHALALRGDLLLSRHDYPAALTDLSAALALVEGDSQAPALVATRLAKRGLALFWLKRYEEAVADTRRAMELRPALPLVHYLRSLLYDAKGDPTKALEAMELAYALKLKQAGLFSIPQMGPDESGLDWLGRLVELRMRNEVDPQRPFMDLSKRPEKE